MRKHSLSGIKPFSFSVVEEQHTNCSRTMLFAMEDH